MTYLQFHGFFTIPPLVLLSFGVRRALPSLGTRSWTALPLVALLALVYTTPWDNFLVWRGVWFYGMDRVVATLGYVPVEEYLFFLLQPFLTGMTFYLFLARLIDEGHVPPPPVFTLKLRAQGALLWLALALGGAALLTGERGTYMGLILVWAAPVLAGLWLYRGHQIFRLRAAVLPGILIPTAYLWVADALALRAGVWNISDRFTLGIEPLGLPIEEAVFFLLTNVLVVFGVTLFVLPGTDLTRPATDAASARG